MWGYDKNFMGSRFYKIIFKQDTSISLWQLENFLERKLSEKKIKNLVCKHRANSYINNASVFIKWLFETDIFFSKIVISAHGIEEDTNLILITFKFKLQKILFGLTLKI